MEMSPRASLKIFQQNESIDGKPAVIVARQGSMNSAAYLPLFEGSGAANLPQTLISRAFPAAAPVIKIL
jgi:hypothetical protein